MSTFAFDRRAALIPIDVQRGFDYPPWGRRDNTQMERHGRALLDAWRSAGWPLIHVRHDSVVPGSSLSPAHPGNAFRDGFEPLPGEPLVSKSVNAAFIGTDLDLRLRRLGVDCLVLFGISTDMCVSTTSANSARRVARCARAISSARISPPAPSSRSKHWQASPTTIVR